MTFDLIQLSENGCNPTKLTITGANAVAPDMEFWTDGYKVSLEMTIGEEGVTAFERTGTCFGIDTTGYYCHYIEAGDEDNKLYAHATSFWSETATEEDEVDEDAIFNTTDTWMKDSNGYHLAKIFLAQNTGAEYDPV